jgi:hypothetical protein
MRETVKNRLMWLLVFGLAMGYLEAAVVVYLREIFYPEGFAFPIKTAAVDHLAVELGREAATIFMLLAVSFLAAGRRRGKFACFMLLFGVWDIAFYFWLWVTMGWPPSLLTWDLLFLIPLIWTGPVLAPVLVSCLLVAAGLVYLWKPDSVEEVRIPLSDWVMAVVGAVVMFIAFVANHGVVRAGAMPPGFPWLVFGTGYALAAVPLARVVRRLTSMI